MMVVDEELVCSFKILKPIDDLFQNLVIGEEDNVINEDDIN